MHAGAAQDLAELVPGILFAGRVIAMPSRLDQ
jgi:hypothetical protein